MLLKKQFLRFHNLLIVKLPFLQTGKNPALITNKIVTFALSNK